LWIGTAIIGWVSPNDIEKYFFAMAIINESNLIREFSDDKGASYINKKDS